MKIRIFQVFHRAIDERLVFDCFAPGEIEQFFTRYGVNEKYPQKRVTTMDGQTVVAEHGQGGRTLMEHRLPWYDPSIQARGYLETSCYVHVLKNRLHESFDYVGVVQYDMRWLDPAVELLRRLARAQSMRREPMFGFIVGAFMDETGRFDGRAFPDRCNYDFLLQSYNRHFAQNWDQRAFIGKPLTLFQTYLLPRGEFEKLAGWLTVFCEELYPWANQPPYPTNWGALSSVTERAEAVFIAARLAEGNTSLGPLVLHHDLSIAPKLGVPREHYAKGPAQPDASGF